jgi:hypothetical protein
MNRADALTNIADPTSTELVSTDAPTREPSDAPTSWEPHQVWLTRVKRPRDLAALRRAEAPALL